MKIVITLVTNAFLISAMGASSIANSALVSRLGGLAYYDDVAGITWLADANAGAGSIFDDGANITDGKMSWTNANTWAESLTVGGVSGWRLPTTLQPDASCDSQAGNVSTGFNCTGSEMGNLFYNVLGGNASSSITLTHNTNYDLFNNVQSGSLYWSSTEYEVIPAAAWWFNMANGTQFSIDKTIDYYAWAVHSGDVSAVPVPTAAWLFGSGLVGLIGMARRKKA